MTIVGYFFLVFTLFYAVMGFFRPHWAFALIVFLFPLKQVLQSYFPILVSQNAAVNAFIALAGGFAALHRIQRDGLDIRSYFNPVTYATYGLYTMVVFGLWYSPSPDYAISMFNEGLPYHILYLMVTPLLIRTLDEFRYTILPVVIGGSLVGLGILTNPKAVYVSGRLVINLGQDFGSSEFVGNPLAVADMGGTIAVFAALMIMSPGNRLLSLVRIGGIVAGLGITVASGSRGQVLAAIGVSVLLYAMSRKIKNPAQFFGTVAGLGVLGGVLFAVFKIFSSGDASSRWAMSMTGEGSGVNDRLNRIIQGFTNYIGSPGSWIQGMGSCSFAVFANSNEEGTYPHNLIIEVLCDYGLMGMTCLTLCLVLSAKLGLRLWQQYREDTVRRATAVVIIGLCLFLFVVSLKQGTLVGTATPFWGLLVLARIATEENRKFVAATNEAELAHEWGDPHLAAQYDEQYTYPSSPHHPHTSHHDTPPLPHA